MARFVLPMTRARRARSARAKRLHSLAVCLVYLEAGFDWTSAKERSGDDGLHAVPEEALWGPLLAELARQGAPLRDAVAAYADELRRVEERDLAVFCRELPTRLNVLLLLFLLPALFLVLFPPLLSQTLP